MLEVSSKTTLPTDSETLKALHQIDRHLTHPWTSFVRGVFTGLGSVLGAALAITIIGWFLNVAGVIPALRTQSEQWRMLLEKTQEQTLPVVTPSK
jgi:hypothetical protein